MSITQTLWLVEAAVTVNDIELDDGDDFVDGDGEEGGEGQIAFIPSVVDNGSAPDDDDDDDDDDSEPDDDDDDDEDDLDEDTDTINVKFGIVMPDGATLIEAAQVAEEKARQFVGITFDDIEHVELISVTRAPYSIV